MCFVQPDQKWQVHSRKNRTHRRECCFLLVCFFFCIIFFILACDQGTAQNLPQLKRKHYHFLSYSFLILSGCLSQVFFLWLFFCSLCVTANTLWRVVTAASGLWCSGLWRVNKTLSEEGERVHKWPRLKKPQRLEWLIFFQRSFKWQQQKINAHEGAAAAEVAAAAVRQNWLEAERRCGRWKLAFGLIPRAKTEVRIFVFPPRAREICTFSSQPRTLWS